MKSNGIKKGQERGNHRILKLFMIGLKRLRKLDGNEKSEENNHMDCINGNYILS